MASTLQMVLAAGGTEYTVYLVTAIVGSTLLGLQVVMLLFGLSHETDTDVSHDMDADGDIGGAGDHDPSHGADGHGNVFFKILSLKALCAFTGLFGLTGLALYEDDIGVGVRITVAIIAGTLSFLLVAWLMKSLHKLTSSGTINLRNAVGLTGSVYLRVPGDNEGAGKVTVQIQGQTMEFIAVTDGEEIATGAQVMVSEVVGEGTLKVVPL